MITAAKDYRISSTDNFFFDNNIWIFLFAPIGGFAKAKQNDYANFLDYVVERKRPIYINSLIVSEYVNACLRAEYEIWKKKEANLYNNGYKLHFLKTETYLNAKDSTLSSLKNILALTTKGNDNFNAINLPLVFNEMESCDFNDSYYLQYAQLGKYIIVTDDGDLFRNNKSGISIITFRP